MTTERDELRLTVTLVDNVSAGLNKIKGEFKDLTEGSSKQHAEKFKKENTEAIAVLKRMGGEAGEAFKAFGMMRLGALGAAGGVALLGFEVAKQIKQWGELADKMRASTQVSRIFGIKPEDLRNIQEQLEAFGVSAEQSMGAITKFADRMGEMQRNPAMRADILRGVIRDPGAEREMERRLAQINEAKSAIEKLNLVRQLGEDIEKNALKRGETPERAAGERRMIEERLGYSPQLRLAGQLKDLTEEQRKAEEARTKNMENYANLLGQINSKWEEINKLVNDSAFSENGIMVKGARILLDVVNQIKESVEYIHEHSLDEFFGKKMETIRKGEDPISKYIDEKTSKTQENAQQQLQDRMEHLRKLPMAPQYFSGGGTDITADWPESSNIEDRRGEGDDRKKYMTENTAELKRLNDFLIGPTAGGGYGFLSGGAGGGGGLASRGGGVPGAINIPGRRRGTDRPTSPDNQPTPGTAGGAPVSFPGLGGLPGLSQGLPPGVGIDGKGGMEPTAGVPFAGLGGLPGGSPGALGRGLTGGGGGAGGKDGNDLDRGAYEKMFKGTNLENQYDNVVAAAQKNGVPPSTMAAIMAHETGRGTSQFVRDKNNPAGLMDPTTNWQTGQSFKTIEEGVAAAGRTIGKNFKSGGGTIPGMQKTYAPIGAANDPRGLNKDWAPGVLKLRSQLQGPGTGPRATATNWPANPLAPTAGDTGYAGVGGYNFMGSERARKMGLGDVAPGSAEARQIFQTGIPEGQGPASIKANKYAGEDMAGFLKDLHAAGAPLGDFSGTYANRMKRGGGGPSQHAYGNAIDIETGFGSGPDNSPKLYAWAQAHPKEFAEIQARHHMRNLDTSSGASMHDWGHFEWTPTSIETARRAIDKSASTKVEGSGKITVDVNAPKGTNVGAEAKGLFKSVAINRQTQMEPARRGPGSSSADAGEE